MFARLSQEKVDGILVWRRDGFIFEEKAPAIKIKRVRCAGHIIPRVWQFMDALVLFAHTLIQPIERAHGRRNVDVHAEMTQPAKTGGDIKPDVIVVASTS